jgi:hypothetical protein
VGGTRTETVSRTTSLPSACQRLRASSRASAAVALVRGSPEQALGALLRGLRRGVVGLVVIGAVCAAHAAAASSDEALASYHVLRCSPWSPASCDTAARMLEDRDRRFARALRRRAHELRR